MEPTKAWKLFMCLEKYYFKPYPRSIYFSRQFLEPKLNKQNTLVNQENTTELLSESICIFPKKYYITEPYSYKPLIQQGTIIVHDIVKLDPNHAFFLSLQGLNQDATTYVILPVISTRTTAVLKMMESL